MGLHRAGFTVEGWDVVPQPRYPFQFHHGDALDADLSSFDFVWASPPCQAHTALRTVAKKDYECFIERTRLKLEAWGGPYVIENVIGAPLRNTIMLCGSMFPPLRVYRHRLFETNVVIYAPDHPKHIIPVAPQKQRKMHYAAGRFLTVTGDVGVYAGEAMGIDWMNGNELSQAIPPAYSQFIGEQVVEIINADHVAHDATRDQDRQTDLPAV